MTWVAAPTNQQYFKTFEQAMVNPVMFKMFKRHAFFQRPVGVTELIAARQMMNTIGDLNLAPYAVNDSICPPFEKFKGIGTDTIRFVETTCLFAEHFKDLSGKSVFEFGSNYGGAALCMLTRWSGISAYYLVDFPVVQDFSFYYLSRHKVKTDNIVLGCPEEEVDYYLAEYSLTEQSPTEAIYDMWTKHEPLIKVGGIIRCNLTEKDRETNFINKVRENFEVTIIEENVVRQPNKILILNR